MTENELIQQEQSRELQAGQAALANMEIQASVLMAVNKPRNEEDAFGRLLKACERPSFAARCRYKYPRGGTQIIGPSVHMAREAARYWGNIRYGFRILWDDEESCHIQGYAWDLESNHQVTSDSRFKKLVYRKKGGWVKPDERDLRELVNKHGAICSRNCVLQIIPSDLIEDAMEHAAKTESKNIDHSIDVARRKTILAFGEFGVGVVDLEKYLGHPFGQSTTADIQSLRDIYGSIRDGNSKWSEYVPQESTEAPSGSKMTMDDLGQTAREAGQTVANKIERETWKTISGGEAGKNYEVNVGSGESINLDNSTTVGTTSSVGPVADESPEMLAVMEGKSPEWCRGFADAQKGKSYSSCPFKLADRVTNWSRGHNAWRTGYTNNDKGGRDQWRMTEPDKVEPPTPPDAQPTANSALDDPSPLDGYKAIIELASADELATVLSDIGEDSTLNDPQFELVEGWITDRRNALEGAGGAS